MQWKKFRVLHSTVSRILSFPFLFFPIPSFSLLSLPFLSISPFSSPSDRLKNRLALLSFRIVLFISHTLFLLLPPPSFSFSPYARSLPSPCFLPSLSPPSPSVYSLTCIISSYHPFSPCPTPRSIPLQYSVFIVRSILPVSIVIRLQLVL